MFATTCCLRLLLLVVLVAQVELPMISGGDSDAGFAAGDSADLAGDTDMGSLEESEASMVSSGYFGADWNAECSLTHPPTNPRPEQRTRPSTAGFSQTQSRAVVQDGRVAARVDFSSLKAGDRHVDNRLELETKEKDYERRLRDLSAKIERMQPNMKAKAQYDEVAQRLADADKELERLRGVSQEATDRFDRAKQERYNRCSLCCVRCV